MRWLLIAPLAGVVVVGSAGLYVWAKSMARREPYHAFVKLPARQKVAFAKALLADHRVPLWVKALPFFLALYLASPIDLVPDFVPVLGYMDDVAMVLLTVVIIARFTPKGVMRELMERHAPADSTPC